MLKRIFLMLIIVVMLLAIASAASAHPAGPCDTFGGPGNSDYARHHIVNATPGHVPGTHMGFSLCLGVH
jgi:hypothetical protein